jgi:hypothetical protein
MRNFTKELTFKVSPTKSLNQLKGKWAMWNSKKKFLKELEGYEFLAPKGKFFAYLDIQRLGARLLDIDNLYGGVKPLIDAIKEKRLIIDDSPKWVKIDISQTKCDKIAEATWVSIVYKINNIVKEIK